MLDRLGWLPPGVFALLAQVAVAWAHGTRSAYLEINETAPGRYDLLWRTPLVSGMRVPVDLMGACKWWGKSRKGIFFDVRQRHYYPSDDMQPRHRHVLAAP